MIGLKYVFYLLLFFIIFMYLLGYDKTIEGNSSIEKEKGKILLIFATIFLFIDIIIGYKIFIL